MSRRSLIALVMLLLAVGSVVMAGTPGLERTFTGTYLCISCDLKKTQGVNSQCDVYGHRHGLKLDNGTYIYLIENDHSIDLIRGGGRENFRMSVTGRYDARSHWLDVHRYNIDGIETTWCSQHNRMDNCQEHKKLQQKENKPALTSK